MREFYERFAIGIDRERLKNRIRELTAVEKGQTWTAYAKAAEYTLNMLKEYGIPNAEILEFPADGQTVYQDKRMPLAWDANIGRLEIVLAPADRSGQPASEHGDIGDRVLADFQKHPFHLIKGSTATPKGGVLTRIVTEQQFLAGEDIKDALVILEPMTWPRGNVLHPILDNGGLGIITDFVMGRYRSPDSLQWGNACTESGDWHVTREDRPFIGFNVSPRTGDKIRTMANAGELLVKAECDGRRYSGKLPVVTAMIPGHQKKEVWIIAHLFEPLLNDDSNGVVAAAEIAQQIMTLGMPEYSLRLVFTLEMYGYAAYTAWRGMNLKNEVLGACNLDSLTNCAHEPLRLVPSGPALPSAPNLLLDVLKKECGDLIKFADELPSYSDDQFISDPTVGIPTVWLLGFNDGFWHSTEQTMEKNIDWDLLHRSTVVAGCYIAGLANYKGPMPQKAAYTVKHIDSAWRNYASKMVFARKEQGFPQSLAKVPVEKRITLPDGIIYGPFCNVLSNLDGKKTLEQTIVEAEAEMECTFSEYQVKKYIDALNFLADWGYLETILRPALTEDDFTKAFAKLGITEKDLLLVHASASKCGYVQGGAKTIINAIQRSADTALYPVFTWPYIYLEGPNKLYDYRPFDPKNYANIWTGIVGRTVLEEYPEAVRSSHITHSWAGLGSRAEECLSAQKPCDPPGGINSPMDKALQMRGKILYIGTGLTPTTFIHFLETYCDMPFLDTAVCKIREADGHLKTVTIEKHLPGHRDFYRDDAENSKFFKRAVEHGLEIRHAPLGENEVQLIDMKQMFDIGVKLLKEDPDILLCNDPECLFCRKWKAYGK